jgi:hypothetical protein
VSPVLVNSSYFIPAGRSFFAAIRGRVFSLMSGGMELDPFLVEFGRLYEQVRTIYPLSASRIPTAVSERIEVLLGGKYFRVRGKDYIQMPDGRRVPIGVSSSGQQEILPLAITLATSNEDRMSRTLFVEEPEAHLFPTAQRQIVHLFATVTDLLSKESYSQYVITTHSPYILAALNNLMYGGRIVREHPEKRQEVFEVIGSDVLIDPEKVGAYTVENGGAATIIDPETKLVEATLIDRVSGELAREFEQLVAIEFGGDAD